MQLAKEAAKLLLRRDSPQRDKCSEESRRTSRGSRVQRNSRNSTQTLPGTCDSAELSRASMQSRQGVPSRRRAIDFGRSEGAPVRATVDAQSRPTLHFGLADETISAARPCGPNGVPTHPSTAARALGLNTVDSQQEEHLDSLMVAPSIRSSTAGSVRRSAVSSLKQVTAKLTPW